MTLIVGDFYRTEHFFMIPESSQKESKKENKAQAPIECFEPCELCTDSLMNDACITCPSRLIKYRTDFGQCCSHEGVCCLTDGINKEGNVFAAMNYYRRIRRDQLLQISPDKLMGHWRTIIKGMAIYLFLSRFPLVFVIFPPSRR